MIHAPLVLNKTLLNMQPLVSESSTITSQYLDVFVCIWFNPANQYSSLGKRSGVSIILGLYTNVHIQHLQLDLPGQIIWMENEVKDSLLYHPYCTRRIFGRILCQFCTSQWNEWYKPWLWDLLYYNMDPTYSVLLLAAFTFLPIY